MPGRKAKPPRLFTRRDRDGRRVYVILDRGRQIRTGCGLENPDGAAKALETYLATKHQSTVGGRDPAAVWVADVLTAFAALKDPASEDPHVLAAYNDLLAKLATLTEWWHDKTLGQVVKSNCAGYVKWRTSQHRKSARTAAAKRRKISPETARHELSLLRTAINEYHAEHQLKAVPVVTLPDKSASRERWLTRHEAARLLGAALGFVWDGDKNQWKGEVVGSRFRLYRRDRVTRTRRRHAARFILIGLYSARRERTIRRTIWQSSVSNPWLDLDKMIYHGRGVEEQRSKKRRPPARIAYRLRPHLVRWRRMDKELSEKIGRPVMHVVHRPDGRPLENKIKTGWTGILTDAGLGADVVRHVLRHTAATWSMQAGGDIWQKAGFLAMSLEVLQETYGHHHPDFQDEAAQAYGGKR